MWNVWCPREQVIFFSNFNMYHLPWRYDPGISLQYNIIRSLLNLVTKIWDQQLAYCLYKIKTYVSFCPGYIYLMPTDTTHFCSVFVFTCTKCFWDNNFKIYVVIDAFRVKGYSHCHVHWLFYYKFYRFCISPYPVSLSVCRQLQTHDVQKNIERKLEGTTMYANIIQNCVEHVPDLILYKIV